MKVSRLNNRRAALGLSLGLALFAALLAAPARASSHREAPGITRYPLWDNTDLYAFRDPIVTDQLTIIANWIPLEDPSGLSQLLPLRRRSLVPDPHRQRRRRRRGHHLSIHLHGSADAQHQHVSEFPGPGLVLERSKHQRLLHLHRGQDHRPCRTTQRPSAITRIGSGLLEIPNNAGPATFPNGYSTGSGLICGRLHRRRQRHRCSQDRAAIMFFVDLGWLGDLLNFRPGDLPGNHGGGINGVAGFNTHTIGMQIPLADVTKNGQFPTDSNNPTSIVGDLGGHMGADEPRVSDDGRQARDFRAVRSGLAARDFPLDQRGRHPV